MFAIVEIDLGYDTIHSLATLTVVSTKTNDYFLYSSKGLQQQQSSAHTFFPAFQFFMTPERMDANLESTGNFFQQINCLTT